MLAIAFRYLTKRRRRVFVEPTFSCPELRTKKKIYTTLRHTSKEYRTASSHLASSSYIDAKITFNYQNWVLSGCCSDAAASFERSPKGKMKFFYAAEEAEGKEALLLNLLLLRIIGTHLGWWWEACHTSIGNAKFIEYTVLFNKQSWYVNFTCILRKIGPLLAHFTSSSAFL